MKYLVVVLVLFLVSCSENDSQKDEITIININKSDKKKRFSNQLF